ncbi:MAG: hypothetical protein ACK5D8_00555 [Bacteroidota bacterium]
MQSKASWTQTGPEGGSFFIKENNGVLYSTNAIGLYKSTDNGINWNRVSTFAGFTMNDLVFTPNKMIASLKNPTIDSLLVAQNVAVHLYNPYTTYETGYRGSFSSIFNVDSLLAGYNPPPNGPYPGQASPSIDKTYLVDIYKVSTTINHSGKTNHFSGAAILQDAWIRNSSSIGWKLDSCMQVAGEWVCDSIDVSQKVYFDTTAVTL